MRVVSFAMLAFACVNIACAGSVRDACEQLAAAECARRDACSVPIADDLEGCKRTVTERCARLPDLPDATVGAAQIDACAAAYEGYSCAGLLLGAKPNVCRFEGRRTNGASCTAGAQCRSTYCRPDAEGRCGECAAVRGELDTCSKGGSPCAPDLHCGQDNLCVPYGTTLDTCSVLDPCDPLHFCDEQNVCQPQAGEGEPCDREDQCDVLAGLVCDPASATCAPGVPAALAPPLPACE